MKQKYSDSTIYIKLPHLTHNIIYILPFIKTVTQLFRFLALILCSLYVHIFACLLYKRLGIFAKMRNSINEWFVQRIFTESPVQ